MRKYWLKLRVDFFERDDIQYLESLPNGIKMENMFLKLCLRSIKSGGKLKKPYILKGYTTAEIEHGIEVFKTIGLIFETANGDEITFMRDDAGADL